MTGISTDVRNYFKLGLLLTRSQDTLRQLFKTRYSLFNGGKVWDDSPTCGNNYSTNVIRKNKKISLTPVQKTSVSNGDSNEWDLTILTALLLFIDRPSTLNQNQIEQLDNEDTLLKQLKDIRNKLSHHEKKSIDDVEFNQFWTEISTILVAFGDINSELDKLKDDSIFDSSIQSINDENVKEAKRLNSLGIEAHKDSKFSDAITLFTKAIGLPGVANHDRAVFYSNMSSSRLAFYEQKFGASHCFEIDDSTDQRYQALQDAKQTRTLWQTWWKGHFRVGKVYAALNEHEKAINSFQRALALEPTNDEVRKSLDDSRQIYGRQKRQEHLDPRVKPITMVEHLNEMKQKRGVNPEHIRSGHRITAQIDPAGDNVVKGHKYEHGDIDVKQDYEQAAKHFAKAASQGNAEGMYNLARLTDRGLGVKKDHDLALELFEQAAAQSPRHRLYPVLPNIGVAEAEHSLGLRYAEGVTVQKNLATAAYWYQRAVDHGSAQSANNLGLMYLEGAGVNQDINKGEQLLELSATKGDPNAMLTLAERLRDKNDLKMAKIWYDRACESGNIVAQMHRSMFEQSLQVKQMAIDHSSPDILQGMNVIQNLIDSLYTKRTPSMLSNRLYMLYYNILNQHANRGSITAKKLCDALEHFAEVLNILIQSEILTEEQEDICVHELSECYRIEHIVAQFPNIKTRQKIIDIVDRVLHRCSQLPTTAFLQLDEDARICYAILNMDSYELTLHFLVSCKQKYPKSIFFFELSAAVNGWLKQYEASLHDANTGLEIDPNYYELLYSKAVALRLLERDMVGAIESYETFLTVAPKDHRKVPQSYYAIASCYLDILEQNDTVDIVRKIYNQGKEAEKLQLPCFLPYESASKPLLKCMFDNEFKLNANVTVPILDRKSRLTDTHRIEVIKQHREYQANISLLAKTNVLHCFIPHSLTPRFQQQTSKSLVGLKAISLKEIDPRKDHIYDGYILSVTIIEEAWSWSPSIHLVIEDENFDCERMFIYSFPEGQGEYLTSKIFTTGSKMNIINPYLRIGGSDSKPLIRIDDFSSIIMQNESERVMNMCRCCGEANALHVCGKCKQARYCSKECQTMDWQLYKHKLICGR